VFPYPTVTSLALPLPSGFKRWTLDWLLRRRAAERLPSNSKVWVAGCGQQQGAHWAMCFPDGDVLATDLSATTLANASSLAEQLKLDNVRFEQGDLMQAGPEAEFDLIVSTGVIHHLPEPAVGLANLRRALKPNGALVFMVYSRVHREPLAMFRTALDALTGGDADPDRRYALACQMIDELLGSSRVSVPARGAFELLQANKTDRSFVADCLLHPLEHSYDVDGVLELLAGAGLRMVDWLQPPLWRLEQYVDDEALLARFAQLDPLAKWRTVYCMAGYAGPLLELVAEAQEAPKREPFGLDEMLSLPLQCRLEHDVVRVERGRVTNRGVVPAFVREGDVLSAGAGGPFGGGAHWQLPAYAEPLLRAFDGQRPAGEVVARFSDEFGAEALQALLMQLTPHDLGLLAPAG